MSTEKETIDFILEKLGNSNVFTTRAMFGEYALYAHGKVVGLVCDDQLYIKIVPASNELETLCEKGEPYPGAKEYYLVEEDQIDRIERLPEILCEIADAIPDKKSTKKKK